MRVINPINLKNSRWMIAGLLLAVSMPTSYAHAQAISVPPSADAARTQEQLRETLTPPKAAGAATPSPLPLQDAPEGADAINFTLNGIDIGGATVYTNDELAALYRDKIGQDVPLSWVFELANAITTKYRNDGYILSRAVIPQQEIHGGRVRLEVVEGYIGNIIVQGADELASKALIERYAMGATHHRPANIKQIERYLLLIRDIPGHTVDSLLRPSESDHGAADLVLEVKFSPAALGASIDNYGSKYLGPLQSTLRVQGNSLLQGGDSTVLRYVGSGTAVPFNQEELRYFNAVHSMQIGGEGTSLSFGASQILSYPGNILKQIDTKSRSRILSAEIAHPFLRSRTTNVSGALQFDMISSRNQILGDDMADDRLRVLRLNGTADHVDNWSGVTQVSVEGALGLDIFGASNTDSPQLSRVRGESSFTKLNVDVSRVQHILPKINLYAGLRTQYTSDRLLSAEEFGVGGGEFGRGYDNSEITGDSGVAGRIELQYNGYSESKFLDSYQLFAFYDVGKVFQSEGKAGNDVSLASAGIGTRFNITDYASGSFTLAQPLTKEVEARSGAEHERPLRALFSFSLRY